jgi:hypothetical protein
MILDQLFEAAGADSTAQRVVQMLRKTHPNPSEATEREILAATSRVLTDQGMSDTRVRFYLRDPDFQSDTIEAVQAQLQGISEGQLDEGMFSNIEELVDRFYQENDIDPSQQKLEIRSPGTRVWTRFDGARHRDPGRIVSKDPRLLNGFWKWFQTQPGVKPMGDVRGAYMSSDYDEAVRYKGAYFAMTKNGHMVYGSMKRVTNPKSVWLQKQDEGVAEMDSQGYRGHRGDEDPGKGPEKLVKPAKSKDVAKDAEKELTKAMDRAHKKQDVSEGIKVVKSDYDLDQMVLTFDIEGPRKGKPLQFTYWDYDEDFENADRKDVFDQLQKQSWYAELDHPTKMEILDASYKAIRGEAPSEYKPRVDDIPLDMAEAMKPSDIPPTMRDRLTMRDVEAERPAGAFRFRVTFPDGHVNDYMTFDAARQAADREKGRISRLSEERKGAGARIERILKMLRARHPQAENDLEALIFDFRSQQSQDRSDIARLDAENDMEEADIQRLERMLDLVKRRRGAETMATESLRDGEHHVATVTLDDGTVKKLAVTTDEGFRERIQQQFAQQGRKVKDIKMDYSVQTEAAKKKPQPTNPELWSRAKAAAKSKFDVYPSAYANAWAAKWYKSKGGGWRMGKPKKD